ncbi:unnamed protein product [Larinioides sclopetarius]|uniref:Uncharacterized protein n=1 Tax=Larinioides sclopetarius TaxID=280406 RepID=A0AAV1ZJX4_9ARAC
MNVCAAIFKGPNPFPNHSSTQNVLTIKITDLVMNVSCFEAFSTEKTYYSTHYSVGGILNRRRHFKSTKTDVNSFGGFRKVVCSFPTDEATQRACATRRSQCYAGISRVMTEKKIVEYETYLNEVLREDLKIVLSQRENLCQEILELEQLKTVIERLQEAELTKETLKTRVDLGCNFYAQANVTDTKYIFIKTGLGIFVQFTLEEAIKFIDKKIEFLNKKVERTLKQSSDINAHIQLILQGLRELQNLTYTSEPPRREVL